MTTFVIVVCMFLTACVSVRFVAEMANYKGTTKSAVDLIISAAEIFALAYLFTLL